MKTTLKALLSSFIQSIDLFNYLLKDHHRRTAILTYKLGKELNLSRQELSELILSASLHDIGAISATERDQLVQMDIDNPHPHARLGAYMLEGFEHFSQISKIVFYHHWPYTGDKDFIPEKGPVPLAAYIIHVADRIDILTRPHMPIGVQSNIIRSKIASLSGTLFHPEVVDVFLRISENQTFWLDLDYLSLEDLFRDTISDDYDIEVDLDLLEALAFTFSKIIDMRSSFTASHSYGVSALAYAIALEMKCGEEVCQKLKIAGLLHDIGKICIATELIEKKGPLTENERAHVETHAYFTRLILSRNPAIEDIAKWASHHHETHEGTGYPDRYKDEKITLEMDILSYADIMTALIEERPYRKGLPDAQVKGLLQSFKAKHGEKVLNVILDQYVLLSTVCRQALKDGTSRYAHYHELQRAYKETS